MALVHRANRRHFYRHPGQLALTILGIALGVAMAVAVDLAVQSAQRAFDLSMSALLGATTHHLLPVGAAIDESVYAPLRREFPEFSLTPVVEGIVEANGETLRLSGFDPLAGADDGRGSAAGFARAAVAWFLEPAAVLLARRSAERLGITPGATLRLVVGGAPKSVRVLDFIEGEAAVDPALEGLLLADIATAQELLGKIGKLDRIDAILPDDAKALARLREALPPTLRLVDAQGRSRATRQLSAAFQTNLQAMSGLGLLVGLFLIYNAMTFAVLQRRELLATLRLLGVGRGEIVREILAEALWLGAAGSALGLALGTFAAQFLVGMVTRTINDVYYLLTVSDLLVSPASLLRGFSLGLVVALLAAALPAVEAARSRPLWARSRSRLETESRRWLVFTTAGGIVSMLVAAGLFAWPGATLLWSIGALFLLLAGCAALMPLPVLAIAATLRGFGPVLVRLGVGMVSSSLSRTGVAVAALTVALAAALGIGIMTASFRAAVAEWLGQLMQADFYVSRSAAAEEEGEPLPADLFERLARMPGVSRLGAARRRFVESGLGRIELLALQPANPEQPAFRFKEGEGATAWSEFQTGRCVLVSEPFASRHRLHVGDSLTLFTVRGAASFPIRGIIYDYRSDRGVVLLHRSAYARWWFDEGITSIGVTVSTDVSADGVRTAIRRVLAGEDALQLRSNREIRDASLALFDRTFAVTGVLRLLAVGVALIGVIGALLALGLERLREFATLRALGLTPRELSALVAVQTSFIGLSAGFLALPVGVLTALVLTQVVQFQSFGWSMDLLVPAGALWQTPLTAWIAALLAGVYPAWKAGHITLATALREE